MRSFFNTPGEPSSRRERRQLALHGFAVDLALDVVDADAQELLVAEAADAVEPRFEVRRRVAATLRAGFLRANAREPRAAEQQQRWIDPAHQPTLSAFANSGCASSHP